MENPKDKRLEADMSNALSSTGRFESLDGLRGIAATAVVIGHAMLMQPYFWAIRFGPSDVARTPFEDWIATTPLRLLWTSGGSAVVLFFVLSGFVLALPWTHGRQLPYSKYLIARFCRIYLPYLAAMVLAAVFAAALGGSKVPGASDWINIYGWAGGFSAPGFLLNLTSVVLMLGNDYSTWLNNPTWSLVWEMRVSLLFPLIAIPLIRWGLRGGLLVAAALSLALIAGQIAAEIFPSASALLGRPHMTFYYAAFFLIGALLARYREPLVEHLARGRGERPLILVAAGLWVWYTPWALQPELMKGAGAALILMASISAGAPRKFLHTSAVQWLGRVSYSVYLVHVPVMLIGEYLLHELLPHSLIAVISVLTALMVSEIFYRIIEGPAHQLGRYLTRAKPGSTQVAEVPGQAT